MKTITTYKKTHISYRVQFFTEAELDSYINVISETMEKDGYTLILLEKWESGNLWNSIITFENTNDINTEFINDKTGTQNY